MIKILKYRQLKRDNQGSADGLIREEKIEARGLKPGATKFSN